MMQANIKLHEGEEILLQARAENRYKWILLLGRSWHVLFILVAFLLIVGIHTTNIREDVARLSPLAFAGLVAIVVVALLLLLLVNYFIATKSVENHIYIVTNQRVVIYWGFIWKSMRILSYGQILDIICVHPPLASVFGLSSVRLVLPMNVGGRSRNRFFMHGLTAEKANELVDLISQNMVKK